MLKARNKGIYVDAASTIPTRIEIIEDAQLIMKNYYANADSLHQKGQRVSRLILESQVQLAKDLDVLPHEIFYTSGGSESNSWAIQGIAFANQAKGKHIITSKIEHASILNACKSLEENFGFEVDYLPINQEGCVDAESLKKYLRDDTILVSLFAINNEIGSMNDLPKLAATIKKHSQAYFHVDGIQALGKTEINMRQIDAISYAAHKIGGLKGSGLLIKRAGVPILPLIYGGKQQEGLRGGTLDNASVILWAKTYRLAKEEYFKNILEIEAIQDYLHDFFFDKEGIEIHSTRGGSPYIFNLSILNVESEIMMNALNAKKIYVSAQSTCQNKDEKSHVLRTMSLSDESLNGSIRLSFSNENTLEEIKHVCEKIMEIKNYVKY